MRNQKLIHPTRCFQLLSHRGVVLDTLWEWNGVMQHIYIVKHERATVKIYRYTLQVKLHFSQHDIYRVVADCETSQRVIGGIRRDRIQRQNR
jgi:hypothetical protein